MREFYPRKLDVVLESVLESGILKSGSDPEDVAGRALVSNEALEA